MNSKLDNSLRLHRVTIGNDFDKIIESVTIQMLRTLLDFRLMIHGIVKNNRPPATSQHPAMMKGRSKFAVIVMIQPKRVSTLYFEL